MGYPVLRAGMPVIEAAWQKSSGKTRHLFRARLAFPSKLHSDNGTGRNYLSDKNNSRYFRFNMDYQISWILFTVKSFHMRHGLTAGILHENRNLVYQSKAAEQTWDWNIYLGTSLETKAALGRNFKLTAGFDARFHLPWFNYGRLEKTDSEFRRIQASAYRGFYYQTVFTFAVSLNRYTLGLNKNDLAGYASGKTDFDTEGMVHHKLDRIYAFFITIGL